MCLRSCARPRTLALIGALAGVLSAGAVVPAGAAAARPHASGAPAHIATWAYDDGCNGGAGASPALVSTWVTYAESNCGVRADKALRDCAPADGAACTAVAYLDPGWIYSTGSAPVPWSEPETWWLHEPGVPRRAFSVANRLRSTGYGGGYLLNPGSAAVRRWAAGYVSSEYDRYPALMLDDTGDSLSALLYGTLNSRTHTPFKTSAEIGGDAALESAEAGLADGLRHANGTSFEQIDNALSPNPYLSGPFGRLAGAPQVNGVVSEGVPLSNGQLTPYYSTLLDEMAYFDDDPLGQNRFVVLLSYGTAGALRARLVQEATVLLGYRAGHTVDWADLETDSPDLAVWPEEGIVPTIPVQTMGFPQGPGCLNGAGGVCTSGGHTDLTPAGAPARLYIREFRACYDQGVLFGACAAIVNDTGSARRIEPGWLAQNYQWQIGLRVPAGTTGDIQSGGSLDLMGTRFVPGVTRVAAHAALLLTGAVAPEAARLAARAADPPPLVAGGVPWP